MSSLHQRPRTQQQTDRPTIPLVRGEIKRTLEGAQAFQQMTPEQRRALAHDMVNVAQFLSDGGGETYGVPLGVATTDDASRALDPTAGALAGTERPDTAGADFDAQGGAVGANAGTDALANVVQSVDFPGFVSGLIQGVFQAIVDASIQQMEAFAELVKNVSKSVDEYMADNITENQARDHLANKYPEHLQIDIAQDQPKLVPKPDADESNMPDFFKDLGLDFPVSSLDEDTTEEVLVPAARQQLAIDRQRMLLMMVMMGINRLVVTDGSIKAAVIFDLNTKDSVTRHKDVATEYDRETTRTGRNSFFSGWFSPRWDEETTTQFNVKTNTVADSEATVDLQAKLTGDVNVRFKSETFPLADMTQLLGLQEPTLPTSRPRNEAGAGTAPGAGTP